VGAHPGKRQQGGDDPVDGDECREPVEVRTGEQERYPEAQRHGASDQKHVIRPARYVAGAARAGLAAGDRAVVAIAVTHGGSGWLHPSIIHLLILGNITSDEVIRDPPA